MLDHRTIKLALRARMVATVVATTGMVSLSATPNGYARTTGSFVTDGFVIGMEITPTGFSNSAVEVVTDVQALTMTVRASHPAQTAASRTLTARMPQRRAFDGQLLDPTPDTLSLREEFVPAPSDTRTTSPNGGLTVLAGFYLVTLFAPVAVAEWVLDALGTALTEQCSGGTVIAAGNSAIRCTQRPGPSLGQILPYETPGVMVRVVRIPWTAQTRAAVRP